MSKVKKS